MSTVRSVYVSRGATVDEVRVAVDAYLSTVDRPIEVDVEFADEYPGYEVAIDVFAATDEQQLAEARGIAKAIARALPGRNVAVEPAGLTDPEIWSS